MTVIDELVEIVPRLGVGEQRRLLDVAIALRDAEGAGPRLSPTGADDTAWNDLRGQVRARSMIVLEPEKKRVQVLGLIDEHRNELTDEPPLDMRASSQTGYET